MSNVDEIMNHVRSIEIEILDVIAGVCEKHGLRYSLAFGTLLGAVRHKGFIPWDDDIDIMMPREDYDKLISVWKQESPAEYILQTQKTDPDSENNFGKIRKDHTTMLLQEYEKDRKYHKGIFVDIFPLDRVAPGKISRQIQYVAGAVNLLYSREHPSGSGGIKGKIERFLLSAKTEKHIPRREKAEKYIKKWNGNKTLKLYTFSTIEDCKKYLPADIFENLVLLDFEGKKYMACSDYDTVLKIQYGDYMQLPPEEERTGRHTPLVLSFDKNFEEL